MRKLAAVVGLWVVAGASPAPAADVHGESDAYAGHGVTLAWAIARGRDEAATTVVVRIVAEPAIAALQVRGQDPFTKAEKALGEARPVADRLEVRIPRASFADFPRTEWDFLDTDGKRRLRVYYLGIPDTTPEFADEKRLDAYLAARIAKGGTRRP